MCLLVLLSSALVGTALAAENPHGSDASPSSANEGEKVKHTFTYRVDNVSNDGNTDELFVTLPNSVNASANALSSFSGNVTDAETGASVSISSSPSIVDGPDGDGVKDTVRIGVQPEGQRTAIDLVVRFTGDVTWPAVDSDTDLSVAGATSDSQFGDSGLTDFASVTVQDSTESTPTPSGETAASPTGTAASESGPGFGIAAVLVAFGALLVAARRRA